MAVAFTRTPALFALACASSLGCAPSMDLAGMPLYPDAQGRLPRDRVARVYGPIAVLDGRDVAQLGDAYEVLPGCHGLLTRRESLDSTTYVTMLGKTSASFVVPLQAGHSYIVRRFATAEYPRVRVDYSIEDFDREGDDVQTIHPTPDMDLATCRIAWTARGDAGAGGAAEVFGATAR
jgi:hypothetical protein